MRVALIALAIAGSTGCSSAHMSDDPDANARWDAPDAVLVPDAPCLDHDGDGFADARCGGDDCDDTDRAIGPARSSCLGPTVRAHCVGGVRVDSTCDVATPDCDARSGECVAAGLACGDLVVHPDEACDGGAYCDSRCRSFCAIDAGCRPGEVCIRRENPAPDDFDGYCGAPNVGGLAYGSPCTSSDQCATPFCDPVQNRCAALAGASDNCDAGGHHPLSFQCPFDATQFAWIAHFGPCQYPCGHDAECGPGAGCALFVWVDDIVDLGAMHLGATCRPSAGTGAMGDSCGTITTGCASGTCVDGVCTRVCLADDDCAAPFPHCVSRVIRPTPTCGFFAESGPFSVCSP